MFLFPRGFLNARGWALAEEKWLVRNEPQRYSSGLKYVVSSDLLLPNYPKRLTAFRYRYYLKYCLDVLHLSTTIAKLAYPFTFMS